MKDLRWRLAAGAIFLMAVTLVGIVGYRIIDPDAGWVNAFYMTAISLTTVGFAEVVELDNNPAGRIFTATLILVGMGGVVFFVTTATAFILEGQLGHVFWRRRMEKQLGRLRDHLIVCGSGETALYTAAELQAVRRQLVLIAEDADGAQRLQRDLPEVPMVVGAPDDDEILRSAGVLRAAGIVACTENDKENLLITLSARQLNPEIRVVTRVADVDQEQKVRRVGADAVVSPNYIGGLRLASELVRPTVVSFLDMMLRDRDMGRRIDEIRIPAGSPALGLALSEVGVDQPDGALLLAVRSAEGEWRYNPPRGERLAEGEVLILLGSPAQIRELCERVGGVMISKPMSASA